MPEFLKLDAVEQSQIYRTLGPRLSRSPVVLEKDVWVCWVLRTLFDMPGCLQMAFKGGTSLSKVFGAISRFSEDVDITLDYRGLDKDTDPFAHEISKSKLKKFSDSLKGFVREHVHKVVVPHFETSLGSEFTSDAFGVQVDDAGEQLRVRYPSVLDGGSNYLQSSVLLEFGGRNITEPNEEHEVRAEIASHVPALSFPIARVSVLSPARTFWEKVTLMHVECQRGELRSNAERLSRHWYDVAMLANTDIGNNALARRDLLEDVVKHKKVFFNAGYANYDACLSGELQLVPCDIALNVLRVDFQAMVDAGMFIEQPPSFESIVDRLRKLEATINRGS